MQGMLKHISEHEYLGPNSHLASKKLGQFGGLKSTIYQELHFPWPLSNRDLVMERNVIVHDKDKTLTSTYRSIEDDRFPEKDSVIRALTPYTMWKFTSLTGEHGEHGGTRIELETLTDSKGGIPIWLINYMQK